MGSLWWTGFLLHARFQGSKGKAPHFGSDPGFGALGVPAPREGLEGGTGGFWDPKVCVSKLARQDFPNGIFRFFFATMVTLVLGGGSGGGGVRPFQYFRGEPPSCSPHSDPT